MGTICTPSIADLFIYCYVYLCLSYFLYSIIICWWPHVHSILGHWMCKFLNKKVYYLSFWVKKKRTPKYTPSRISHSNKKKKYTKHKTVFWFIAYLIIVASQILSEYDHLVNLTFQIKIQYDLVYQIHII